MRSPDITQGQIEKAASGFFGGCNTMRNPWILDESQYANGVNIVNRGGVLQTRPGFKLGLTLPPGNLQGFAIMTINKVDVNGNKFQDGAQFMIVAVEGLVYAIPFPLVQPAPLSNWTQYQLMNLQFAANAERVYFCVAQKSLSLVGENIQLNSTYNVLVMQDGITAAAFWDGDLDLHVNENPPDSSIPSGTWMAWSGDRLWVARGNALIAGDLLDPLSFKERISGSTQGDFLLPDTITGMVNTVGYTFQTQLICFTQDQTFSFLSYVTDRENWSTTANFQTILYPALGCVAGLSIVNHAGLLWWYAKGGLVSFNSATTAYLTSRVKYMDNEMVQWTSEMYEDRSGICANSFGSYLSISIPSSDVFNAKTMVMDYAVADELNSVAPSAWQGVWTGIRPVNWITAKIDASGEDQCFALSVDYEALNQSHNHIWLAFQDERTDSFDYVDTSNAALTQHNPIYWSVETKLLGDGLDLKVFRHAYVNLMEISGQLNFKVSYRGTRGTYKELINKKIIAITEPWQTNDTEILQRISAGEILVPQTRRLVTQVAQAQNKEQYKEVESPYDETIDRCFSLYFQGCGQCAVESLLLIMEPYTENPTGQNNEDEETLNVVTQDGDSEAYPEGTLGTSTTVSQTQAEFNFNNNLYTRPFTPRNHDVYYSSIPPLTTSGVQANCITCLPCSRDYYPKVTLDPTSNDEGSGYGPPAYVGNAPQSYTATCPLGTHGASVTVNIPASTYFALTIAAANQIAFNSAYAQANAQLVCTGIPVVQSDTETTQNGAAFSYQIIATLSPTSYGATGLPTGLTINTATGLISGTMPLNAPSSYSIGLSATNASGTGYGTLTLNVNLVPVVTGNTLIEPSGMTGFSYQISATNTPSSYGATGLPVGLSLNSSTGVISGTLPYASAVYNIGITASNSKGTGSNTLVLKTGNTITFSWATPPQAGLVQSLQFSQDGAPYQDIVLGTAYAYTTQIKWRIVCNPGTYTGNGIEFNLYGNIADLTSSTTTAAGSTIAASIHASSGSLEALSQLQAGISLGGYSASVDVTAPGSSTVNASGVPAGSSSSYTNWMIFRSNGSSPWTLTDCTLENILNFSFP